LNDHRDKILIDYYIVALPVVINVFKKDKDNFNKLNKPIVSTYMLAKNFVSLQCLNIKNTLG